MEHAFIALARALTKALMRRDNKPPRFTATASFLVLTVLSTGALRGPSAAAVVIHEAHCGIRCPEKPGQASQRRPRVGVAAA